MLMTPSAPTASSSSPVPEAVESDWPRVESVGGGVIWGVAATPPGAEVGAGVAVGAAVGAGVAVGAAVGVAVGVAVAVGIAVGEGVIVGSGADSPQFREFDLLV